MVRADLLLDLVRAGAKGDHPLFRKSLEALSPKNAQNNIMFWLIVWQPISARVAHGTSILRPP